MKRLACLVALACAALVLVAAASPRDDPGYRVRAIFDSAPVNVGGGVLVAGATVGRVSHLDVTPEHKAALTLTITDRRFVPFRADARCGTRPQSLIGERTVSCETGSAGAPPLREIRSGRGRGEHLLPVQRTFGTIDLDLVNAIYRQPTPQQLSVLLSELGAGVATRGPTLASIIRRANPGLDEADRLVRLLAGQRRRLQRLATDGVRVTRPLARSRRELSGFIRATRRTATIAVEHRAAYAEGLDRLPGALRDLRPVMEQLDRFARATQPVLRDVAAGAPDLGRATAALPEFARQSRLTLPRLATSTGVQARELRRVIPLARRLTDLGRRLPAPATDLSRLLESFRAGGGIGNLLRFVFEGATAGNGFDGASHFARAEVLSGTCGQYTVRPFFGCDAQFGAGKATAAAARTAAAKAPVLDYLLGDGP